MKTLYIECNMGAAGDMLLAAFLELHPDPVDFLTRLNEAGIPGVRVTAAPRHAGTPLLLRRSWCHGAARCRQGRQWRPLR